MIELEKARSARRIVAFHRVKVRVLVHEVIVHSVTTIIKSYSPDLAKISVQTEQHFLQDWALGSPISKDELFQLQVRSCYH